jgi:hypothetical protein
MTGWVTISSGVILFGTTVLFGVIRAHHQHGSTVASEDGKYMQVVP